MISCGRVTCCHLRSDITLGFKTRDFVSSEQWSWYQPSWQTNMFLIAWQRKIKLVQSKRDITLLQTDSHMQRCSVCPPIITNQKSPGLLHGKPIIVFPTNTAFLWKRAMYINVFSREGEREMLSWIWLCFWCMVEMVQKVIIQSVQYLTPEK